MAWTRAGRLGALGGAGGALLAGALAVAAVAGGSSGDPKEPVGAGKEPVGGTEQPERPADPTSAPSTEPAPDPLCVAHQELTAVVEPIGAVDGPAELEASMLAQVTFHTTAAEVTDEPDASAFRSVAGYYGALRDFFAPRGWRPDAGATDFGALPAPPTDGSLGRTADILAERCGLERPTDNTVAPQPR
jgi:hypothetical protein